MALGAVAMGKSFLEMRRAGMDSIMTATGWWTTAVLIPVQAIHVALMLIVGIMGMEPTHVLA
jgi:sterol desaturase/sphingolipid hydroxylase (fatty acid hydroxylase superfamily)